MGNVFVCYGATIPDGMTCAAGPDGCGYCRGVCKQPVAEGAQGWVVDERGEIAWPGLEVWGFVQVARRSGIDGGAEA